MTGVPFRLTVLKEVETKNFYELEQSLHKLLDPAVSGNSNNPVFMPHPGSSSEAIRPTRSQHSSAPSLAEAMA